MAAEIQANLVLDTAGLRDIEGAVGGGGGGGRQGFAEGLRGALQGLDLPVLGDIGAGVAGLVLLMEQVFNVVSAGFNFLRQSSPRLETSIQLLGKSLGVLFRPIGDILSLFVKPLAIAILRFAVPVWKKWREFLESPAATAGLDLINTGIGNIVEGLTTLDFDLFKQGFSEVFEGAKTLAGGFFDFLGDNLPDFISRLKTFLVEAFDFFVSKFAGALGFIGDIVGGAIVSVVNALTGAEFETVGEVFKGVLKSAWDGFFELIKALTPEQWENTIEGFKVGLEALWSAFTDNLKEFDWAGPLAPFFAAVVTGWEEIVSPLVDALVKALEEKIPGITALLSFAADQFKVDAEEVSNAVESAEKIQNILEKSEEGKEKKGIAGVFQSISEAMKVISDFAKRELPVSFDFVQKSSEKTFGKSLTDEGNTVLGSLHKTIRSLSSSQAEASLLTMELNRIPREITTRHTIVRRVVRG